MFTVTTHIQMKLVMGARMATQPPLHRSKLWAMIFLQITLTVQQPMNRAAPSSIRTSLVDIVSTFTLKNTPIPNHTST